MPVGRMTVLAAMRVGLAVAMLATAPTGARAQAQAETPAGDDWAGKRVVQKARDFALRDDKQAVLWVGKRIYVFEVVRADEPRLWLRAPGEDGWPTGWAAADEVVPIDHAIAFFTERIRANPKDAFAHLMRATVTADEIEDSDPSDKQIEERTRGAVADFGEAIRLDPKDALSYKHRGQAWAAKGDREKAASDDRQAELLRGG